MNPRTRTEDEHRLGGDPTSAAGNGAGEAEMSDLPLSFGGSR